MSSSRWESRPAPLAACSKRRRRTAADATTAATHDSSSWASLHEDLVDLIACRVLAGDLRDYIRFRAVCPNWRSSTACPRGRGIVDRRFYPRRWMLQPEGHGLYPRHASCAGSSGSSASQLATSSGCSSRSSETTASSTLSMVFSCCSGTTTPWPASSTLSPVTSWTSRLWRPS
ncbi:unnamed protein product [Urochloa humidicola]